MAVVELRLAPLPAHVRTARLVVVAAARRAGLDTEHVDELRLALGEACSRAVGLHARHAPATPVVVSIQDDPGRLTVTVTDQGPPGQPTGDGGEPVPEQPDRLADQILQEAPREGDPPAADLVDAGVSLAVVASLVDDVAVEREGDGTVVTMRWPLPVRLTPLP